MKTQCPTCNKEVSGPDLAAFPTHPFCSDRCRMADLDRWFTEDYRVKGRPFDESAFDQPGADELG